MVKGIWRTKSVRICTEQSIYLEYVAMGFIEDPPVHTYTFND